MLAACGGSLPGATPAGFINQTQHSDQDLWTIWATAQQSLARQVDLNPLQRSLYGAPADIRPGDRRALRAQPQQLRVAPQADVSSNLLAAAGIYRSDPTGLIACPQPCNVHYAAAYSFYKPELTRYAASWESQGNNFSVILEYEFENQILAALGYDVRWR